MFISLGCNQKHNSESYISFRNMVFTGRGHLDYDVCLYILKPVSPTKKKYCSNCGYFYCSITAVLLQYYFRYLIAVTAV